MKFNDIYMGIPLGDIAKIEFWNENFKDVDETDDIKSIKRSIGYNAKSLEMIVDCMDDIGFSLHGGELSQDNSYLVFYQDKDPYDLDLNGAEEIIITFKSFHVKIYL